MSDSNMSEPSSSNKIVLLAGASGLVGGECLRLLASDNAIKEIRALVRRPLPQGLQHAHVRECVVNFDQLETAPELFAVDWVFCTLGTTIRDAGSQQAFHKVDYDYPLTIAKLARARGATHFLLVSALGASAQSTVFYNRVKGELEDAIGALGYPSVTIARPSLLLGERKPARLGEEMAKKIAWLVPPKWKPVHVQQVATTLVSAAHADKQGVQILENVALRANV